MTNILTKLISWFAGLFKPKKPETDEQKREKLEHILRGLPHLGEILDIEDIIDDDNVARAMYLPATERMCVSFFTTDYASFIGVNVGSVDMQFWGIDLTTLRMQHSTRRMQLSLKAQEELPRAILKAKNLRDRFIGTLTRIILVPLNRDNTFVEGENQVVDSIGIAVEYQLLDETKYFMAYFKNNEIKKKLHGAAITNDNAEKAYRNAVASINQEWKNNGSSLLLTIGEKPWDLALNACKMFYKEDKPWALKATIASEDFREVMRNLLHHDIYKIRLGVEEFEYRIVMDPVVRTGGYIEFSPVFKTDNSVLATAVSATQLNKRL